MLAPAGTRNIVGVHPQAEPIVPTGVLMNKILSIRTGRCDLRT